MASWNQVRSGFIADDETNNFGTRTFAEDNGSLYEVSTLATIQSVDQVDKKPNILVSLQCAKFCVAVDQSITIFQDEKYEKVLWSASFSCLIACYCISKDGLFLFVVLTDKTLYCMHLSDGETIFTKNIPDIQNNIINIFLKEQDKEVFIILVTESGAIHRFSGFHAKTFETAYINKVMITKYVTNIQCAQLFEGFTSLKFLDAAINRSLEELSIVMVGSNSIFIWPNQHSNFNSVQFPFELKKIMLLKSTNKMLCLRTDHVLSMICQNTLLGSKICDNLVLDFTIMNENINYCDILFLTQPKDNHTVYTLSHISYPDFEEKLKVNVSSTSYLTNILDTTNNIFYIEGVTNENGIINTFKIKMISENVPEMHLAKLLRRNQVDAAEAFAKKSGLSMEPIYCSKAALFIQQLGPWTKYTPEAINIDILIDTLDKIQNISYVIECCSKAFISNYIQMRQLYLYARERIARNMKEENIDEQLNYKLNTSLSLMNNTLHRFETFHMIQNIETNILSYNDITMKKWIKFSQVDLLEECNIYLRMGQTQSAALIWTRHQSDIMKNISKQSIQNFFMSLPKDMSPSCLWPWLIHFIPALLSLLPDTLDEILSWGLEKLKYLEISHHAVWPEIGTEFAKKFIGLLNFGDTIYSHQEYRRQNSVLKQFTFLFQALAEIQHLNATYRLRVPLDIYISSPIEAIYILLDKIYRDEISAFVNTFLKQYILNNNLQNDSVLSAYIQDTVRNFSGWWSDEEAVWEKRLAIIVNLIHNIEKRLEQTLEIIRRAPVPWSPIIDTLAKMNSHFDHDLSSKIENELNYVAVKLVLKKYGYAAIGVKYRLISFIIKEDRNSLISDIDVLTRNDQQLKQVAFCRCINTRLNEGKVQKAIDIIHHLEDNIIDVLYYYEGVINYIVAAYTLEKTMTSLEYHMEILSYLEFKMNILLTKSKVDTFRCNNIISTIRSLKSLYTLKKNYNTDVSFKDYRIHKTSVLQNCIIKIYPDIKKDDLSLAYKIIKIAKLLGLEKSYAILSMSERVKNTEALLHLVADDELDMTSDEFKNINKICLSILQHITVNIDVIQIVKNLSVSALNTCQNGDIQSALLLYTYANICPSISIQHQLDLNKRPVLQPNWKLYTIYKDQAISLDQRLLSLFRDAICLHLLCLNSIDSAPQDHTNQITNHKLRMDQLLSNFLENAKKMQLAHNDYSVLQILKTFYFVYCSTPARNKLILMEIKSILSQLLTNLLKKICIGWPFDLYLGLSCLFILSEQETCAWISTVCTSFSSDYIRDSIISILGYEYSRLKKNQSLMQTFKSQKLLHIWAQQLHLHCSISYKEVLLNDSSSKRKVLQQIINSNNKNVISLIKGYCYNFGFNFDDSLLLYLQTLLKTWNPTIYISNTFTGKELRISKDEVDELRTKCDTIIAQIENKSILKRYISTLWEHISFYHYEAFTILMDLTEDYDMKKKNVLCFLENYIRTGSPTSIEYDEWILFNPEHTTLPSIAQWRLPFLLKVDMRKLITPELNLKTYEKWLEIAPVLNLETYHVCTLAVKGEITRLWGDTSVNLENITWSLYSKNPTLLENIKKCIQRITNSDRFYYATAALYYVVNHISPGADRVAAVKECYEYAKLATQNSRDKIEKGMLEKIRYKYFRFTSEHILRTHGLEKDRYFALIEDPCKLVHELYNDESIPLRYRIATDYRPDINDTVNELGKLFSLNTIQLRLDLIQEWLHSNTGYIEIHQNFTETFQMVKDHEQNYDYEDDLFRICYILEYGDRDLFVQFLINIGFDDDTQYNCDVRYRAIRVLQNILDDVTLEELTKRDIYTFRKYMKSLQYISKLECLGLCYNVNTFEACSKQDLVQILWKTQCRLPYALVVITQICIEFDIYDALFWDNILNQMTSLQMINDLKKVLLQVRNQDIIVNCNGYRIGWQLIISEPFRQMDLNPNTEQINNCVETICMLYSCPIVHELDFIEIVKTCFERSKQEYLVAALLPFLSELEKKYILKKFRENCEISEVIMDLKSLSSKGVLTIEHSLLIIGKMTLSS